MKRQPKKELAMGTEKPKDLYGQVMEIINRFPYIEVLEDEVDDSYHSLYVCCVSQESAQAISDALEAANLGIKSAKAVTKEVISEGGRPEGTEAVVMIDLYSYF
jgi:NADH/NAD ratio-sensing transcriptional regulator Rex